MLRTSNYTIYVDLPEEPEKMLLVHGYSGAYDKVSRRVATYVRNCQEGPIPKPLYGNWSPEQQIDEEVARPSDAAMEVLQKRGYLTALSPEEESERFAGMVGKLHHLQTQLMPGYIMMPTYQCNLRCSYCFQDHMRTNPKFRHLLKIMTPDMVDRIFTAMPEIELAHGIEDVSEVPRNFTFFGGEPLLAETRSIVEYIIDKAATFGPANFTAVSNATDLHHFAGLIGPGKIGAIQITLDGPPEEHDRRRIYADGKGSFKRIAQNITMALELGAQINLRMNIDRNNIDQLPELAQVMIDHGWSEYKNFSAYTAAIHANNDKTDKKTTFSSWTLVKELDKLREQHECMKIIGRPDDGLIDRVRSIFDTRRGAVTNLKASFCGAHNKMYIFDALGDIYACWEKTGDASIRIAAIDEESNISWNEGLNNVWRQRTVTSNPVCKKCRYSLYCGGGCAVLAEIKSGNLHTNFCDGFQSRLRAAVAEAYDDHLTMQPAPVSVEQACDV
ncbi:MAG: radical SAM protein [Acidobacteriota bacterium]